MTTMTRPSPDTSTYTERTAEAVAPGLAASIRADIELASQQLDNGEGIPAEEVWRELGLE